MSNPSAIHQLIAAIDAVTAAVILVQIGVGIFAYLRWRCRVRREASRPLSCTCGGKKLHE
jgi:hypothetical protein